jgi:hypothetical protein
VVKKITTKMEKKFFDLKDPQTVIDISIFIASVTNNNIKRNKQHYVQ